MTNANLWILPEGIEEILPPYAAELELLCRKLIDQFGSWGYELIIPPLVEYLESLLTGTGEDMDLKTFKITDQLTGRMMGIRADITPQAARIDSSRLRYEVPARLCYLGTTLHTRPVGQGGTRAPMQVGAELFGHSGVESDVEILTLMLKTLQLAGLRNIHVDIGHVGIYRGLIGKLGLSSAQELLVFNALQKKAVTELGGYLADWVDSSELAAAVMALTDLHGDYRILDEARAVFAPIDSEIVSCIDDLEKIAGLTVNQIKDASLFFDLAELRGYKYHNGMMFTAYTQGHGQGIAFGGRYDGVGREFGRSRPATGFSADVKLLFDLLQRPVTVRKSVFAPVSDVPGLQEMVNILREGGEKVICQLPGQSGDAKAMGCDRELYLDGGKWKLRNV